MTKTDQRRQARAKMREAQFREDSAAYLEAMKELAALEETPRFDARDDARDKAAWIEAVRERKLEIYRDKYEADANREAAAFCEQAENLTARRDSALSEVDRALLVDLIVRLDQRDTHESLASHRDTYVYKLAQGALGRAEARCINDAMGRAQADAIAELTQEAVDAEASHAAVRDQTHAIRMRAMRRDSDDDELSAIWTMHANYRTGNRKPLPN
jgi:hypothetical protein